MAALATFAASAQPQEPAGLWAETGNQQAALTSHTVSEATNGIHFAFDLPADDDSAGATAARSPTPATSASLAVEVPDATLSAYIRAELGLAAEAPITQGDMANLTRLDAAEHAGAVDGVIANLTGLEFATNLARLYLPNNAIADISALSGLTSLGDLRLNGNEITDISALAGLTRLSTLWLQDNEITELSALSGMQQLTWLRLSGNAITDVSPLADIITLSYLWLYDNEITDVSPLSGLRYLWSLLLDDNAIADISPLSRLTALQALRLSGNEIADVSALSGLESLESLDIYDNRITDVSLSDLYSLAWLDMSGNAIERIALSDLPSLTSLYLSRNEIERVALSNLTSLRWLDLSGHAIVDLSLSGLTELTGLWLDGNAIADLSPLAGLTSLTRLGLDGNAITDVSPLSGLTALTDLSLGDNAITEVSPLSDLTALTDLSLAGNAIADLSPLSGLTSLTELVLRENEIADVTPLSGLVSLAYVSLSGNPIADLSPLSGLTSLESLYIAGSELADLSALSGLTSLSVLSLSDNAVADVSALSDLTSLRSLYLHDNAIADIAALSRLPSLSTLYLNNNVVAEISPLVESGLLGTASYVDLRGNPLTGAYGDHARALRESGAIVLLDDGGQRVPLFPAAAAGTSAMGFVRVINHSDDAGSLSISAIDEAGERRGPVSLAIGAGQALHFNAADLEQGNSAKGLSGGIGEGIGDWRLVVRSKLDIEVLGYGRTPDGFVTSLHDLAPEAYGNSWVPTFNPGSNRRQVSRLRVVNPTDRDREVRFYGRDDAGMRSWSSIFTQAGATRDSTAAELEQATDFFASIGDGVGKWRLRVYARGQPVLSLLQSPTGHLANISTGTRVSNWQAQAYRSWARGGRYRVPLFLAASNEVQGFLRIVNLADALTAITLRTFDSLGVAREPVVLTLKSRAALHLNSHDLEFGNIVKGMPGFGSVTGDWHLEVSGDRRFETLAYARTADGFVTSLHDIAPRSEDGSLWIPFFNPGKNSEQASRLRLVNWGGTAAEATIAAVDDAGKSPGSAVRVTVPARSARDYMSWELETGNAPGLSGAWGVGTGKWRLRVTSSTGDVEALSLLRLPTGHITNLSTTPRYRQD